MLVLVIYASFAGHFERLTWWMVVMYLTSDFRQASHTIDKHAQLVFSILVIEQFDNVDKCHYLFYTSVEYTSNHLTD